MMHAQNAPSGEAGSLSDQDWQFVRNLLRDLQAEEHREQIAYVFGQWVLSTKAFRRVEFTRMVANTPNEQDLLFHRALVTNLISVGTLLVIAARPHEGSQLAGHGLRLENITAMLLDLQNTFDEWHGQVPEERLTDLRNAIFHAAPELHLQDSRA